MRNVASSDHVVAGRLSARDLKKQIKAGGGQATLNTMSGGTLVLMMQGHDAQQQRYVASCLLDWQHAENFKCSQPSAHYPSHRHSEIEEQFLLLGDLHVEGQIMRTGDYCRAHSGTIHSGTFSDGGCLFLLLDSQQNEVLA